MRLSRFFLPTSKETPADAEIASHRLMLRAGMIRQNGAGIYTWLPLGHRILRKIEQIVREEQNRAGAVEMLMPTIQTAELWRESGRYDAYGEEMLRITDRGGRDMLYGPTNEEMITDAFRAHVRSYKQLPLILYHMQWKFRDELRPRFGIMRGREFLMKDAYSFDLDRESAVAAYHKMYCAYLNTFDRLGLKAVPTRAETGPIGGDLSHEFIILAQTGESRLYCDSRLVDMPAPGRDLDFEADLSDHIDRRAALYSAADALHDEAQFERDVAPEQRLVTRGIEIGHIFYFGTKYSVPMKAMITAPDGRPVPAEMGSYGIGVSRLVGAMIEANHDDKGMIWPLACAPFTTGIVNLKPGIADLDAACEKAYTALQQKHCDPLYDDTKERPGTKLSIMELIGIPLVLVMGPKGLTKNMVELRNRQTGTTQEMSLDAALQHIMKAMPA